jgi:hypothetical protein
MGDLVIPVSGTSVKGALWPVRTLQTIGLNGESVEVNAEAFLAGSVDVRARDLLDRGALRFEVIRVISGESDLFPATPDHVGVMLKQVERS